MNDPVANWKLHHTKARVLRVLVPATGFGLVIVYEVGGEIKNARVNGRG